MNKQDILNFFNKYQKIPWTSLKNKNNIYYIELEKLFPDSKSMYEKLYRLKHNIIIRPVCKICGGYVEFKTNVGFRKYCSVSCAQHDDEVKNKSTQTKINKYGDPNWNNQQLRKKTMFDKYGGYYSNPEKCKQTCIKKYGVDNYSQSKLFKIKTNNTWSKKTQNEINSFINKIKNTKKIHFNNSNYNNREKANRTCIIKYGENNFAKTYLFLEKQYITKTKNKSWNKSKEEDLCYELLKEKYPDIIRQYRSKLYPFNCDFYIPSKDLYVEYNGSQYHQDHPFNINNENDIKQLNILKEAANKNNRHKFGKLSQYDTMIYVWTDLDVRKRNIAKQNKLNFIEFWNLDDVNNYINQI